MRSFQRAVLVGVLSVAGVFAEDKVSAEWKLVWRDEFEGSQLDSGKWSPCARGTSDWDDTMSKDPGLIELKEGVLRLHGVANEDRKKDPSAYLTAGVTSQGKFDFQKGKLEVSARFKCAQGAWPAIWLLPSGQQWPKGGEIDVMEHLNFEDLVYQTIHTPYTIEAKKTATPDDNVRTTKIKRDDFNTYGMEWDDEAIVFLVNGVKSFTYKRDAAKGDAQWPFSHPMYLILSMQIGGTWVGEVKAADYPAYLEVDWVRVYSRDGEREHE